MPSPFATLQRLGLATLALLSGCSACVDVSVTKIDSDGDGATNDIDCNDARADIYPGAEELCDGEDNDCDGQIDEGEPGAGGLCDTGGIGACAEGTLLCERGALRCVQRQLPEGDSDPCDGRDNDCDGQIDEAEPQLGLSCETEQPGRCLRGRFSLIASTLPRASAIRTFRD